MHISVTQNRSENKQRLLPWSRRPRPSDDDVSKRDRCAGACKQHIQAVLNLHRATVFCPGLAFVRIIGKIWACLWNKKKPCPPTTETQSTQAFFAVNQFGVWRTMVGTYRCRLRGTLFEERDSEAVMEQNYIFHRLRSSSEILAMMFTALPKDVNSSA